MTKPTKEQVLEWEKKAGELATETCGEPGYHNLYRWQEVWRANLCALAYAEGARDAHKQRVGEWTEHGTTTRLGPLFAAPVGRTSERAIERKVRDA